MPYIKELNFQCSELIHENLLTDEKSGRSKFRDFIKEGKAMARLFENFIRNFYKIEQKQFEVSNPKIAWQIISFSEDADSYLPEMRTDICLANEKRKIIIDCKFYKETFQKSYDRKTIHSQHLYQLISYLINKETDIDWEYCEGILLYPVIDGDVECESRVEIKDAKSMTYRH